MNELSERRQRYSSQPSCEIVTAEEFMQVMTSHLEYVREDEPSARLVGLRNPQTGQRVFVKTEELEQVRNTWMQLN